MLFTGNYLKKKYFGRCFIKEKICTINLAETTEIFRKKAMNKIWVTPSPPKGGLELQAGKSTNPG